ncbi:hypothetical protein CUMW_240980 [Citrus unshiu]|uniref:Ubiquitin-like protease family profile domain-containing protein n=1 Tax=Citrus unshiu TaxID=55188 RepID=A0A2H5QLC6_CITUN|nr:hypothetical protein CUMW_240980 [Citrus unshiu]
MTKSKLSDIKVGRMYFRYADHFPGRISSMYNLSSVVKAIDEKLTKRQLNMFKKDIFGHFLECRSFPFSGVILHNLLLRQVAHEEDSREDQLWFQISEHLIRLSIVKWCLVTGLSYGVDTELRDDKKIDRLWKTYFGGVHRKINIKEFDALFKELKFEEVDDMDALKIALFYFANRVLNERKNHCQINFDWLNEVDDIQYFRNRPWGLVSWEMVYDSLDDTLFEKDEKFKTTRLKNPDHNIEKYNLYGFTSGVQAWIYEAIGGLPSTWVIKTKNKIPRIVQWKPMASLRINFAEVYSFFNDKSQTMVGFIDTFSTRPNKDSPTGRSYAAPDDYGVYTDVGNQNLSTPTSLYSFYGDVSGESVQVFSEVPSGISKFGLAYIPSYVYNSPYMIPPLRRGKNARPIPRPQIMDHTQDMNKSVDINPLRGLEDSSLFAEFDRWFAGDMTVVWRVQYPQSFFQILLGLTSMGWLGDEHIYEYLRLISEKQRLYLNALVQHVKHTDTFFWVTDCAVDSLVFDDRLNSFLCGRQHTMSKSMTDVDMLLIPVNLDDAHWVVARVDFRKNKVWINDSLLTSRDDKRYKLKFKPLEVIFPRWLEYVGFYNIRPELRSADPWKVIAVKSAPQQESGTGNCGFNDSHVEYFRKKIAVDIFNDDIIL